MREDGYYFAKYQGSWVIAELIVNWGWALTGFRSRFQENDFDEIGDKIELPMEIFDVPHKYNHSTYNSELIEKIRIISNTVTIYTKTESQNFTINENLEGCSADYLLCMLQDKNGINVQK